jgi:uncharacterized protein (DUF2267 family)
MKSKQGIVMGNQVNLEKYCNETKSWLSDIAGKMRVPGRNDWAFNTLRAVLHTIRDRTTIQEVFHLSAQLPVLIRGIYFEGYKPTGKPLKMNSQDFMKQIKKKMGPSVDVPAAEAFRAVIDVLYERVSPGEMNDIKGSMPKDIQRLWDSGKPAEESVN